jgi:hypothetical protein
MSAPNIDRSTRNDPALLAVGIEFGSNILVTGIAVI